VERVNVLQLVYVTRRWGRYVNIRGRKGPENGEDCGIRSFVTCTVHKILLVIGVTGKRNACGDWWTNLKERDHFVDPEVDWT
jgi:hypothetical protein